MNKFKKYILAKYPNRSPKILFQLQDETGSNVVFEVQEIQDLWELWQFRQIEIDKKAKCIQEGITKLSDFCASSTDEVDFFADVVLMLKGKKVYKAAKIKHSHIFMDGICECGWTVADEFRVKKPIIL